MKGRMAKSNGKNPQQWSEITYLRVELDKKLKSDLEKWLKAQSHDWLAYIEKEIGAGLRFGVHDDTYNRCVEARLTALSQSAGVNTLVLQGRGPDMLSAIQALFFKHYVVLEGDWTELDRDADNSRYADWG